MVRSFINEFEEGYISLKNEPELWPDRSLKKEISLADGLLMSREIKKCLNKLNQLYPNLTVRHYAVKNLFFGESITVSGLLTGHDILNELRGKELGEKLFLPENLLRSGTDMLLDDMTLSDISAALNIPVGIIETDGMDFIEKLLRG